MKFQPTVVRNSLTTVSFYLTLSLMLESLLPKTRSRLIQTLFLEPGRSLHLRELGRLCEVSAPTLGTEAEKLVTAGILLESSDGNRRSFRANPAHPFFAELQSLAIKETSGIGLLRTHLEDLRGIRFAFIFGSVASGEARPDSDLDLCIIGTETLRSVSAATAALSGKIGREINPVTMTPEEFSRRASDEDAFVRTLIESPRLWIIGNEDEFGRLA